MKVTVDIKCCVDCLHYSYNALMCWALGDNSGRSFGPEGGDDNPECDDTKWLDELKTGFPKWCPF